MIIYRILNRINGKSYVGQSTASRFSLRYSGGRWWEITHNILLKRSVKKYGLQAFEVQILEANVESKERLDELERHYALQFDTYAPKGYNLRGCGEAQEVLPNVRRKIAKRTGKPFILRRIDTWEIVEGVNLKAFCQEHELHYLRLISAISQPDRNRVSQGYCHPDKTREQIVGRNNKRWRQPVRVVSPSGEIHEVLMVYEFAKQHGLHFTALYEMLKGKAISCAGWTLASGKPRRNQTERYFELLSPSGEIRSGYGLRVFCQDNGIDYRAIGKVLRGEMNRHRGWSLPPGVSPSTFQFGSKVQTGLPLPPLEQHLERGRVQQPTGISQTPALPPPPTST